MQVALYVVVDLAVEDSHGERHVEHGMELLPDEVGVVDQEEDAKAAVALGLGLEREQERELELELERRLGHADELLFQTGEHLHDEAGERGDAEGLRQVATKLSCFVCNATEQDVVGV